MRDWAKRNEAKAEMAYVPVAFNASMANLQKLYYALDAMGKEKELRAKVFSAIHTDRSLTPNADADAIAGWAEKNGIDRKKFVDTFNSFSVQSKVNRANQLAAAYGVTGVPQLGVAGKYLLTIDSRSIANADVFLNRALTEK
jgi:thiol:disulfide interchange protein DsbA